MASSQVGTRPQSASSAIEPKKRLASRSQFSFRHSGMKRKSQFQIVSQAIAMTLHELATNAAKYGSLSVPEGHLCVKWWQAEDRQVTLHWTESGGPPTKKPARKGFGISVIKRMIQEQGEIHLDWRAE